MALTLVFLGRLEDAAGAGQLVVPFTEALDAVLDSLEPDLAAALGGERIRIAQNGTLVADKAALQLSDGDELAFLPPVSGG